MGSCKTHPPLEDSRTTIHQLSEDPVITINPLSQDPTAAWEQLSKTQKCTPLFIKNPKKHPDPGYVRIVCMSDTHCENENFKFDIPNGDFLIHAGDFTRAGQKIELHKFNAWLSTLPHKNKIVIAGNHELSFDEKCILYSLSGFHKNEHQGVDEVKKILTECTYLQDSAVTLYGLKIYGAPWQPEYGGLAFNVPRGEKLLSKWNLIPEDTDILVTHGPPLGHGDRVMSGKRAGCAELLSTVQKRVKPKYHIFGHIHEAYGITTDGTTTFINASTCNRYYKPVNLPIVFDMKV